MLIWYLQTNPYSPELQYFLQSKNKGWGLRGRAWRTGGIISRQVDSISGLSLVHCTLSPFLILCTTRLLLLQKENHRLLLFIAVKTVMTSLLCNNPSFNIFSEENQNLSIRTLLPLLMLNSANFQVLLQICYCAIKPGSRVGKLREEEHS